MCSANYAAVHCKVENSLSRAAELGETAAAAWLMWKKKKDLVFGKQGQDVAPKNKINWMQKQPITAHLLQRPHIPMWNLLKVPGNTDHQTNQLVLEQQCTITVSIFIYSHCTIKQFLMYLLLVDTQILFPGNHQSRGKKINVP